MFNISVLYGSYYTVPKIIPNLLNDLPLERVMLVEEVCHDFPWTEKTMGSCLSGRYYNSGLLLNDRLGGFYVAEKVGPDHTLMDICVALDLQGQGYASQLMSNLIERATSLGAENCFLEVRQSNETAIALYEKFDFAEIGVRKNYYPAKQGKENAILMARSFL